MDDAGSAAGASLIIRLSKRSEFRYPSSFRSTMPAGERSAVQMRSLFLRYGLAIGLSSVVLLVTVLAPQLAREGVYILALAAIVVHGVVWRTRTGLAGHAGLSLDHRLLLDSSDRNFLDCVMGGGICTDCLCSRCDHAGGIQRDSWT